MMLNLGMLRVPEPKEFVCIRGHVFSDVAFAALAAAIISSATYFFLVSFFEGLETGRRGPKAQSRRYSSPVAR